MRTNEDVMTVREQIAAYRLDIQEQARRVVEDVQRGKRPLGVRKREEAVLKVCRALWEREWIG